MRTLRGKTWVALTAATAVALAASLAGVSTSTASAAPPAAVSIDATVTIPNPIFGGVWQASGAINDSGTFVRTDLHISGSVANSPVVGALQVVIEFSGSLGTFTVRDQLLFGGRSTGLSGTWQIVSGTGAYERASGHGTSEFVFPNSVTFTGVISKAG
jgi:hypothetical protein